MAPYRKQKIRLLLRKDQLDSVHVSTVDAGDSQGQEELVVFISTTLSHPERLSVSPTPRCL